MSWNDPYRKTGNRCNLMPRNGRVSGLLRGKDRQRSPLCENPAFTGCRPSELIELHPPVSTCQAVRCNPHIEEAERRCWIGLAIVTRTVPVPRLIWIPSTTAYGIRESPEVERLSVFLLASHTDAEYGRSWNLGYGWGGIPDAPHRTLQRFCGMGSGWTPLQNGVQSISQRNVGHRVHWNARQNLCWCCSAKEEQDIAARMWVWSLKIGRNKNWSASPPLGASPGESKGNKFGQNRYFSDLSIYTEGVIMATHYIRPNSTECRGLYDAAMREPVCYNQSQ